MKNEELRWRRLRSVPCRCEIRSDVVHSVRNREAHEKMFENQWN